MAVFFIRPVSGNDVNDGLSFANAVQTVNTGTTAARTAPGDSVRLEKSPDPTLVGTATFTNKSNVIELTEELVSIVHNCETVWTLPGGSPNSVTTDATDRKFGARSSEFVVVGAFTTGLVAYAATASGDYSSHEQLSFWTKAGAAVAASSLSISLCSDAAGATPVDTFLINHNLLSNRWYPITINKGSTLGASIQSVALYVDIDLGGSSVTLNLDHIIACKAVSNAKSITLNSIVGKNTTTECWYPLRAIDGPLVFLDLESQTLASTSPRGYAGISGSGTLYKRECFKMPPADTSTATNKANEAGTSGSPITYVGGYDSTAMTTIEGETWFDGLCNQVAGWSNNTQAYIGVNNIKFVRGSTGFQIDGTGSDIGSLDAVGCGAGVILSGSTLSATGYIKACSCSSVGVTLSGTTITVENIISVSNVGIGIQADSTGLILSLTGSASGHNNGSNGVSLGGTSNINIVSATDNGSSGILISSPRGIIDITTISASSNTGSGINAGTSAQNLKIQSFSSGGNTTSAVTATMSTNGTLFINYPYAAESTFFTGTITAGSNSRVITQNVGGVFGINNIVTDGGTISASGGVWTLSPTSTSRTATYPLRTHLATYAVSTPGTPVTVIASMRRSNSAITGRLLIRAKQIGGIGATDLTATVVGTGSSYENVTLSFTPTERGTFEVVADGYGGTSHTVDIRSISCSQA